MTENFEQKNDKEFIDFEGSRIKKINYHIGIIVVIFLLLAISSYKVILNILIIGIGIVCIKAK